MRDGVGDAAGGHERRAHRANEHSRQQHDESGRQRHEQRARGQPQGAPGNRHARWQAVRDQAGRDVGEDARQRLG